MSLGQSSQISRGRNPFGGVGSRALHQAQQQGQKTFSWPEEASNALVTAAQSNDEKMLVDIFGARRKANRFVRRQKFRTTTLALIFVKEYQEMHRLVKEPDGTTTLYIGAENSPTPIPLVNKGNLWYFDTEAGKKKFCTGELAEMNYRPFAFARNSWRRKRMSLPAARPVRPENLQRRGATRWSSLESRCRRTSGSHRAASGVRRGRRLRPGSK